VRECAEREGMKLLSDRIGWTVIESPYDGAIGKVIIEKASDLKRCIGCTIEIKYAYDHHRGTYLINRGILERIEGRNIVVSGEYYWFNDVKGRISVMPNAQAQR
jgi:hypothetical protein